MSCAEIWRLYRGRGDAENHIKELKYDFEFDSFNLKDFHATEAALSFVMISYYLMSIFSMFVLQEKTQLPLIKDRLTNTAFSAKVGHLDSSFILRQQGSKSVPL